MVTSSLPEFVRIAAAVFGVIFIAELPDKTALAALVLATRYRPWVVFLGASAALTLQSLVAIVAGRLVGLLPERPVHVGAGVLFLVFAVFMWRRKEDGDDPAGGAKRDEDPAAKPKLFSGLGAVFGVVFLAEWGDLTQLGTAVLAARYAAPVAVFVGATLALWSVTAIAVVVGSSLTKVLRPERMQKVAAVVFAAIGGLLVAGVI